MQVVMGRNVSFEYVRVDFGLYRLYNRNEDRIPDFLRPERPQRSGLPRQTTIGNYHGPSVHWDELNRKEYLLLNDIDLASTLESIRVYE
jgi:hypothetical protein